MERLVIYRDAERLAEHDLSRGVSRLGRHPENDIVLDDRTLSRFHAKIMRQGGGAAARWVVVDLGAQNGVHLNGERIDAEAEVELQPGDRIELGKYTAVLELLAPAPVRNGNNRPAAAAPPAGTPGRASPGAATGTPSTGAPAAVSKAPSSGPPKPASTQRAAAAAAPPAPAAPTPRGAPRGGAIGALDLDEDLGIGDDLDVDIEDALGDDLPDDLGSLLDDKPALGEDDERDGRTNTNKQVERPRGPVANARGDGMTTNLSEALAGELGDDLDDVLRDDLDDALDDQVDDEVDDQVDDQVDDEVDDVSHAAFVPPRPTFVLLFNGLEVSRHALGEAPLTIGRSKQCDVVISLLGLSRKHAQMTIQDEGVVVEDLGSQNGTWVNNQRISGRQVLKHGDLLNFYDYGVLFLEDGDVDVGLAGASFPAAPATANGSAGKDDLSARQTDRALPVAAARPATPAKAAATAARSAAPTAPPAAAAAKPAAAAAKPAARPALVEPPARPRPAGEDDDDLGLSDRASLVDEATAFGRQRPGGKRAAGDDRFELDELGDGSFLGDEFDEGASKDRGSKPAGARPPAGRPAPAADELSRAGDDVDLEAAIAFDNAARPGANDEFADLHTDGEVHGLADRTSAGIDVASLHGLAAGIWPTDDDLERVLAQTNDTAVVTVDVTMKGKSYAQIPLSQAVTRVGTDPRCECALPKTAGLRAWHLTFVQMGGAVVVLRANRAAALELHGREVDVATLRNGDIIRLGGVEMKLRLRR